MSKNENSFTEVIHMDNKIQIFEDKKIRTAWDEEKEEWYFSVVDVVSVLTDSKDPTAYRREGAAIATITDAESVEKCIKAGVDAEVELELGGWSDENYSGGPIATALCRRIVNYWW